MNAIISFVKQYDYYYLFRQGYNTYFEKLIIINRVSIEKHVFIADRLIFLDNLKIKLLQVEAKDSSFRPNQILFEAKDIYNRVAGLICMHIEEFEKRFALDLDYKKNIYNSYQAN